jgi:hypothetical protein
MLGYFKQLDQLLRGERTRTDALSTGNFDLRLRTFVPLAIGLGCTYGFFMGWYAMAQRWGGPPLSSTGVVESGPAHAPSGGWMQLVASVVKVPALFLLTLVVTFPSLYVFNALVGTRLSFAAVLRLLVAAIVVNLSVAASLGTILAFFTLSTTSYHFMVLLNVVLLAISGCVGLGFLLQTLKRLSPTGITVPLTEDEEAAPPASAANTIFYVWIFIYSLVGMQMGWLLRPFIGKPDAPFEWFRTRQGNFFQGLFDNIQRMIGS